VVSARPSDDDVWLTRAQVAAYLSVSLRTVARYIDTDQLRAYKRGPRAVRILKSDVDAMFREMPAHEHDNGRAH
jgi:excisionase family DNA binding protein